MADLSILIPARNEMFLARTIEDILQHIEADTEIIAVLDGAWTDPPIKQNDRVNVIYLAESIGQRAATNLACRLSRAKYVMKIDAHCSFDQGFDRKMLEAFKTSGDNATMVPIMRNLWAFDWKCHHCGWKKYQGPTPTKCEQCGKTDKIRRKMIWVGKNNPQSTSYCFDVTPHFQYFEDWKHRPAYIKDKQEKGLTETMSLQGSCWILTRDKYWELNICDEGFGGWGSQGIEVAVKTWLSGGRVLVNHKTWYAHMFRTQGGDFGFPYPMSGRVQRDAQSYARNLFFNNNWQKQIYPFSWLIEKFWPVKGWTDEDLKKLKENKFEFNQQMTGVKSEEIEPGKPEAPSPLALDQTLDIPVNQNESTKGIIYLSDCQLDDQIAILVRGQLTQISEEKNIPIVSATLKKMQFGVKNINFPSLSPGYFALTKQIIAALEHSESDIIFFCEHDVLYHPTHFDFTPKRKLAYYYNTNVWRVRYSDGFAVKVDDLKQLSGLCGFRKTLLKHYLRKLALIEKRILTLTKKGKALDTNALKKYLQHEPGTHRLTNEIDRRPVRSWRSEFPNIDIRHDSNLTKSLWSINEFEDKKQTKGWIQKSADEIPGWEGLSNKLGIHKNISAGIIYYTDDSTSFNEYKI